MGAGNVVAAGAVLLVCVGLLQGPVRGWGQGAAAAAAGPAQQSSQGSGSQGAGAVTLYVNSRETVVDVTVTDAKGQPVHDLKESDFTVKEDGKPQPLRTFQEIREDTPPATHVPPRLPPNVYTNLQPPPTTSAVNILLLDALNTLPVDMVTMKQESIKYLRSMTPGTRIAVLGLSSSLRILQGFTSDPAILIAAVDTKKSRALPSPFIDNDSANVLGSQADDQSDLGNDDVAAGIQQFANELATEQQDIRNRMTLEALNQIAAYVAGIKGRKNLIWFTDGMPLNMFPTGGTNDLEEITDYSKELRKTTDLLTAAEVSVYPVDARKLFNNPATGADQGLATINKNTGARVAVNARTFQEKKGQEILSMEAVAEATGGIAYHDTNDLKAAVAKAISNGANYYSISYVPPDLDFDGRYHAIDVAVDRPNVHLGYRKGYNGDDIQHDAITPALPLTTSAPEPYGNNMQASMGRGVPTASQLLFSTEVEPSAMPANPADPPVMGTLDPKLQGKPLVRYVVQYSCPARQITFSAGPGGINKATVEFDVAAYDVFGKRITGLSQTFNLQLTAEKYQQFLKTPFRFYQQIDLPPGEIFLRVGVLDGVSDKVGTLEIPLIVKKQPAGLASAQGGKGGN
jgi:VWFA-related protein